MAMNILIKNKKENNRALVVTPMNNIAATRQLAPGEVAEFLVHSTQDVKCSEGNPVKNKPADAPTQEPVPPEPVSAE